MTREMARPERFDLRSTPIHSTCLRAEVLCFAFWEQNLSWVKWPGSPYRWNKSPMVVVLPQCDPVADPEFSCAPFSTYIAVILGIQPYRLCPTRSCLKRQLALIPSVQPVKTSSERKSENGQKQAASYFTSTFVVTDSARSR